MYPLYSRRLPATPGVTKLPMDIGGQQQKNQLDLCQNVRVMSILVFFSGERVNGGRVGVKRQAGVKDFELTGPCQWTLVTNSKTNQLDLCQNVRVMSILVFVSGDG